MRLSARERRGASVEAEVREPDIDEKGDPRLDFAQEPLAHGGMHTLQLEAVQAAVHRLQWHGQQAGQVGVMAWLAHAHGPRFSPKPTPPTGTAGLGLAQLREFLSDGRVVGLQPSTCKVGKNALKGLLLHHTSAPVQWIAQGQAALPRPMQKKVLDLGRQGLIRGAEVNALLFGKALQNGPGKGIALVPACNGARGERQVRELHNSLGIEAGLFAQAVTGGAGPCGGVE